MVHGVKGTEQGVTEWDQEIMIILYLSALV